MLNNTNNDLIKAVRNTLVTNQQILELESRLAHMEHTMEQESFHQKVTNEFLSKEYTI